jgi:O-antigen ligase
MTRTGLAALLMAKENETFPHPHNAYLEMLLDNGWVGLLLVLPFYLVILARSLSLFARSRIPLHIIAGGVASALVLALLVASYGSQTFYPREGSVGMWCAIGLMLRVSVERARARAKEPSHSGVTSRQVPWWRRTPASA